MYSIKVDPHTHTIFSGHAFSTIEENIRHAAELQLEAIAMTEHFSPLFTVGEPTAGVTMNMQALPKVIYGVRVLAGAELDIVDLDGHLAFYDHMTPSGKSACERMLETREFAIASVHTFPGFRESTVVQNTNMYCNVLRTTGIDMLGHIGRAGMLFDINEVLTVAKETGKIIEINEHSMDFGEPVVSICRKIAERCAEMGVYVAVSSDAHSSFHVGGFARVLELLGEIHFPEELIANTSLDRLLSITTKNRIR